MPHRRQLALLFAATICNFTAAGMYFAAIPLFVNGELGGSNAAAGISVGAFSISAVLLRPTVGRGVDSRGRRPYMLGALAILMVSSLLFLLATSVLAVLFGLLTYWYWRRTKPAGKASASASASAST